ncbi:MAG: biopolymer transporter ExbD [Calditrichaeota bacterium]|nr:MAG: biopolymer transporter ExbD [Calditrichota bacterium]
MRLSNKRRRKPVINITSLIDVLFLLLIFMMISSTFLEQPGMKLDLPKAESAEIGEKKELTIYVTSQGELFLNSDPVSIDQLKEVLEKKVPGAPDKALTLKADAEATHGMVVRVMDIARLAGVKKLLVATQPAKRNK